MGKRVGGSPRARWGRRSADRGSLGARAEGVTRGHAGGIQAAVLVLVASCGSEAAPAPPVPTQIEVTPQTVTLVQFGSQLLVVRILDQHDNPMTGTTVTFVSSAPATASAGSTGVVRSVGPAGSATITVSAASLSRDVPVTVTAVPTALQVTPDPVDLPQLSSQQLTARVMDAVGAEIPGVVVVFLNDTPALLTVSTAGLVGSLGPAGLGRVVVLGAGLVDTVAVTITQVPTSLVMVPASITTTPGVQFRLFPRLFDVLGARMFGTTYTFSSEPSAVASVTPEGVVSIHGPGTAQISVSGGGFSAYATVSSIPPTHPAGSLQTPVTIGNAPFGVTILPTGLAAVTYIGSPSAIVTVDLNNGSIDQSAPVGGAPGGIVSDPLGTRIYAVPANLGRLVTLNADYLSSFAMLDLAGTDDPWSVAHARSAGTLYVGTSEGRLALVDTATLTVASTQTLGGSLIRAAWGPTSEMLYLASSSTGEVVEFDGVVGAPSRRLRVGGVPKDVAVSLNGEELYIADDVDGLKIWSLSGDSLMARIPLGDSSGGNGPFGLALTPDGTRLFVTIPNSGAVAIIDPTSRTVLQTLVTNGIPARVAVSPAGDVAVVANQHGWIDIIR